VSCPENTPYLILLAGPLLSGALTWILLPQWIKLCQQNNLLWENMNQLGHPKTVAGAGGSIVLLSFLCVASSLLVLSPPIHPLEITTVLLCVCSTGFIGLADDMMGWKKGGLPWELRLLACLILSLPLIPLTTSSHWGIPLPWVGTFPLSAFAPLLIPLGFAAATTTFNLLAGFNGLEAGQGALLLSTLSLLALQKNLLWLSLLGLTLSGSLLTFLLFNKYPAQVFPGDSLTWSVGALAASICLLGNLETAGLILLAPFLLEGALKAGRGKLQKGSFGLPQPNGTLLPPYPKVYGLTHLVLYGLQKFPKQSTEKNVTRILLCFQALLSLTVILISFKRT